MATEQAFPSTAAAFGGGRVITSPFQFVADADTFLRVVSVCSVAGVTLAVQGRRLDDNGQIQPMRETHTPNSNRTSKTQDYGLGRGAILNLTVFASAGAPLAGQCYVMVQLLRNFGGTAIVLGTLLGGYVTAVQALGFPGSPIVSSLQGEPALRDILGTDPLAGNVAVETVPAGARWELTAARVILVTSGVGPDRRVILQLTGGGVVFAQLLSLNTQPLGTSLTYTCGSNVEGTSDLGAGFIQFGTPARSLLPAAGSFLFTHTNFDAGDNYQAPQYQVREWLEVN